MRDTIRRYLTAIPTVQTKNAMDKLWGYLSDRLNSVSQVNAGLVIHGAGSTLAKTGGSVWYGLANGKQVKIAASTDLAALSGTVTNAKFNVFVFMVDSAGNLTSAMGTEDGALNTMKFPEKPVGLCIIGYVIINPTGTGNFVGGTTALDDVTVVPNAVYISSLGPWDPNFLIS